MRAMLQVSSRRSQPHSRACVGSSLQFRPELVITFTVRDDGHSRLRVTITLRDTAAGRGDCKNFLELEVRVAAAIQPMVRQAEIDRSGRQDPAMLNAWG